MRERHRQETHGSHQRRHEYRTKTDHTTVYDALLNIGGRGIMGYVTVEKIGVELPIYHGTSQAVLSVAAGHVQGSSLPTGGSGTHGVICAHSGLSGASLFTGLDQLELGDTFTLTVLSRVLTYQVDQIRIVEPRDTGELTVTPGEDHCTLMTCTPYGVNSHRLLVRGVRTEYHGEEDPVGEILAESMVRFVPAEGAYRLLLLSALSLAGVLIAGLLRKKRRKHP